MEPMAPRVSNDIKIKARYRKGVFEPVEPVELPEDTEVEITVRGDFFTQLNQIQADIEATGVSEEEFSKIVDEVTREARRRTGERMRKRAQGRT